MRIRNKGTKKLRFIPIPVGEIIEGNSVGVNQTIIGPTHYSRHTPDLLLISIITVPQSEAISDHYLISFQMCLNMRMSAH